MLCYGFRVLTPQSGQSCAEGARSSTYASRRASRKARATDRPRRVYTRFEVRTTTVLRN